MVVRTILGFHPDDVGDWVAELSCWHNQHVRHRPPFQERAWVRNADDRAERVGGLLECPLCDRAEMPVGLVVVRTAGPWGHDTLPPGLRRAHRTAEGVWGGLVVLEGRVGIRIETSPPLDLVLETGTTQPIPPSVMHEVVVIGPALVQLQLWGRPGDEERDG